MRPNPTVVTTAKIYVELVHRERTELECMGKERKNESKKTRVGKDFDCSVLELVDGCGTNLFGGNRSKMTDYNLPHF